MNKKATVMLLVALVLVAAAGILHYETRPQSMPPSTTPPASSTVSYTNDQYDFTVTLPADWQGYTIVTSTWRGNGDQACPAAGCPPVTGPIISIRNPLWTSATPTQDIPIMIFTLSEWSAVSSGTMPVSAAPIPPSELGQNSQYVFALPARYNYAYPADWQEVQTIMQGDPLRAF
jgi:hypothetical protein